MSNVYVIEWFGVAVYIRASSAARAKAVAMRRTKDAGFWDTGKSLKGLKCRLADYVPPDEVVLE